MAWETRYGETRVSSTHSYSVYEELLKIAEYVDFNSPIFANRPVRKRRRDLSSVQALLVELALDEPRVRKKLRILMLGGGRSWTYQPSHQDRYFFDDITDAELDRQLINAQSRRR